MISSLGWPDLSVHVYVPWEVADNVILMENTFEGSVSKLNQPVPLPEQYPLTGGFAPFLSTDGPHLVYCGGGWGAEIASTLVDLWWKEGANGWESAPVETPAPGAFVTAYATPDGVNHAFYSTRVVDTPGERPEAGTLAYCSWRNNHDGTTTTTYCNIIPNMHPQTGTPPGGIAPAGAGQVLAAYANPDGNEWCFFLEGNVPQDNGNANTGRLWCLNIRDNKLISSVDAVEASGASRVGPSSGIAAFPVVVRVPIVVLRGEEPMGTQHVFYADGNQELWELSTGDGLNFTAVNLTTKAGAPPAFYGPGVASALAGFPSFTYPRRPFQFLPFPEVTQRLFYIDQDDVPRYIWIGSEVYVANTVESLLGAGAGTPKALQTQLAACPAFDGTWHVDYLSSATQLDDVCWTGGNRFASSASMWA